MTLQRALELLEANEERKSASAFVLYKKTVKEALEKQMAKKPVDRCMFSESLARCEGERDVYKELFTGRSKE